MAPGEAGDGGVSPMGTVPSLSGVWPPSLPRGRWQRQGAQPGAQLRRESTSGELWEQGQCPLPCPRPCSSCIVPSTPCFQRSRSTSLTQCLQPSLYLLHSGVTSLNYPNEAGERGR